MYYEHRSEIEAGEAHGWWMQDCNLSKATCRICLGVVLAGPLLGRWGRIGCPFRYHRQSSAALALLRLSCWVHLLHLASQL